MFERSVGMDLTMMWRCLCVHEFDLDASSTRKTLSEAMTGEKAGDPEVRRYTCPVSVVLVMHDRERNADQ